MSESETELPTKYSRQKKNFELDQRWHSLYFDILGNFVFPVKEHLGFTFQVLQASLDYPILFED